MSRFAWIAGSGFAVLLLALTASMFAARQQAQAFASQEARQAWEAWRQAASGEDRASSPVERRPPKSAEPPSLVLLRDHFGVCLAGAGLLTSAVYWACALLLRGALSGPRFEIEPPAREPPAREAGAREASGGKPRER